MNVFVTVLMALLVFEIIWYPIDRFIARRFKGKTLVITWADHTTAGYFTSSEKKKEH